MRIPKHIAIIPDGNRRWATQHQMEKKDGYQHGLNPGLEVLRKAKEYGVAEITYYGFTVDNCKRPKVHLSQRDLVERLISVMWIAVRQDFVLQSKMQEK